MRIFNHPGVSISLLALCGALLWGLVEFLALQRARLGNPFRHP